jgi:hypothetical protein
MVGKYLATLTLVQEDRVLMERLAATSEYIRKDGCRCLVGVTRDGRRTEMDLCFNGTVFNLKHWGDGIPSYAEKRVGLRFDALCLRFGEERVNAAIRNRILSNQARRTLTTQAVLAG